MRLNIATNDPQGVKEILEKVFINEDVTLEKEYKDTADYKITSRHIKGEFVYPAESIMELSYDIPLYKIRIY